MGFLSTIESLFARGVMKLIGSNGHYPNGSGPVEPAEVVAPPPITTMEGVESFTCGGTRIEMVPTDGNLVPTEVHCTNQGIADVMWHLPFRGKPLAKITDEEIKATARCRDCRKRHQQLGGPQMLHLAKTIKVRAEMQRGTYVRPEMADNSTQRNGTPEPRLETTHEERRQRDAEEATEREKRAAEEQSRGNIARVQRQVVAAYAHDFVRGIEAEPILPRRIKGRFICGVPNSYGCCDHSLGTGKQFLVLGKEVAAICELAGSVIAEAQGNGDAKVRRLGRGRVFLKENDAYSHRRKVMATPAEAVAPPTTATEVAAAPTNDTAAAPTASVADTPEASASATTERPRRPKGATLRKRAEKKSRQTGNARP